MTPLTAIETTLKGASANATLIPFMYHGTRKYSATISSPPTSYTTVRARHEMPRRRRFR